VLFVLYEVKIMKSLNILGHLCKECSKFVLVIVVSAAIACVSFVLMFVIAGGME